MAWTSSSIRDCYSADTNGLDGPGFGNDRDFGNPVCRSCVSPSRCPESVISSRSTPIHGSCTLPRPISFVRYLHPTLRLFITTFLCRSARGSQLLGRRVSYSHTHHLYIVICSPQFWRPAIKFTVPPWIASEVASLPNWRFLDISAFFYTGVLTGSLDHHRVCRISWLFYTRHRSSLQDYGAFGWLAVHPTGCICCNRQQPLIKRVCRHALAAVRWTFWSL